ncbi:MAG: phosphatidylinositol-specific phospholipase C domain-containing protein [Oscillospiraceae bacterium]|nr:phosphatidylinositol-specific phospholipase C domain-containing protein [Oscillospiraceae bacterium]
MKERKEKKKTPAWKIVLRILAGLLGAVVLFLLVMFTIPLTETGDRTPVEGSADWMARLDDETSLAAVVLPGTHDSATRYVQLGYFSKCQAFGIGDQLRAGYRYLDIRLAVAGEKRQLMHGFTKCRVGAMPWTDTLTLDAVLADCYRFLAEHPTETVLFAVKQERGAESVAQFQAVLDGYVQLEPDRWLLTDEIPTLGEARGKLVLLRRYDDEAGLGVRAGIPLIWEDQRGFEDASLDIAEEPNGSYTLRVQDRFEYETEEKWAAFIAGMEKAPVGEGDVAIHFLSTKGHATFGHPFRYAKELDARLTGRDALAGWIVVDFASAPLAEHIYSRNFD